MNLLTGASLLALDKSIYFYHSFTLTTLNLLRKDEKGIDGMRKTNSFVQKSLNC